jgi:hypothetical protein
MSARCSTPSALVSKRNGRLASTRHQLRGPRNVRAVQLKAVLGSHSPVRLASATMIAPPVADRLLTMASFGFGSAHAAMTMRNAVLRLVLARAAGTLHDAGDRDELEMAEAFGGIAFDRLEPAQRLRIGNAVRDGLLRLRRDVTAGADLEEPVHPDIQEKLDQLVAFMDTHLGHGDPASD